MLNIFQVYYSPDQLRSIEFTPYDNRGRFSVYLENAVIADLAESGDLFRGAGCGVFSWRFRQKGAAAAGANVETIERYLQRYDSVSFFPHLGKRRPPHNIFTSHSRGCFASIEGPTLAQRCEYILHLIGKTYDTSKPVKPQNIVYSNHFIAKPEVYREYYETMLKPAMQVMETDEVARRLAWGDAKYHRVKDSKIRKIWEQNAGVPYYTLHAFILERFFSVFLEKNPDIRQVQYGQ